MSRSVALATAMEFGMSGLRRMGHHVGQSRWLIGSLCGAACFIASPAVGQPAGANLVIGTCTDLQARQANPGVYCADNTTEPGASGCVIAKFPSTRTNSKVMFNHLQHEWCASWAVTLSYIATTDFTRLVWLADPAPCCTTACEAEEKRWDVALDAHEKQHIADANTIVAAANKAWASKTLKACSTNKHDAEADLKATTEQTIRQDEQQMVNDFDQLDKSGAGLIPLPDCTTCQPSASSHDCCNGACADTTSDPANCGGCGVACPSGKCIDSQCVPQCPPCYKNDSVTGECVNSCLPCEACNHAVGCVPFECLPTACYRADPGGTPGACCVYTCPVGCTCSPDPGSSVYTCQCPPP